MRKFFKSLAVLLALTLIVGVVPAAAADSLTMAKEKTLYLGGSQGAKEDGTNCKITAKKKVANMIKGFDADTMTVVLSSADKSIVKTTKAGRIVAKSIGTTTVTVTVLDATEKEIFKQDLKVKVKKNATDVTVTGIVDGDNFKVGQTVEVTLPRAGVDTDERELTVDKADNVEIKASTEKARVYSVKFIKAGEVTFTAKAYQSTKYPVPTQKKDIKVNITNPAPTSIKVVASNAYELTFDTDVEAAGLFKDPKEIANDACYYMLNDTKVTQSAVKAVKATGNVVKVTMYDNFAAGTTYYVVVNGSDPLSFVIAGTAAKDVTSIAIISDTAVVNTLSPIKVALYNADGVDITSSVGTDTIVLTSTNLNSFVDGLALNMYTLGDVTDLTATFTYYDPNNNYEAKTKTATKKITAVAPASMIYTGVVYSVDGSTLPASQWYENPKNYIAIDDTNFYFRCSLKYTLNGVPGEVRVGTNDEFNGQKLVAKIPEESIALLGVNSASLYPITANTVGATNVFIGYEENNTFKTVAVCPIEVKAKRAPTSLTVKTSKSNLNTQSGVGDTLEIQAEVKDQYGDACRVENESGKPLLVLTQNDQSKKVAELLDTDFVYAGWGANYKITVDRSDIAYDDPVDKAAGNIVFTTKVDRWDAKTPVVSCSFSAKDAGIQDLASQPISFTNAGSAQSLDTTITGTTELRRAKLEATTSNNGYYTGHVAYDFVEKEMTKAQFARSLGTATGVAFQLVIKFNNKALNPASLGGFDAFFNKDLGDVSHTLVALDDDVDSGIVTLDNFVINGSYLEKLNSGYGGTFTFTLYKYYKKDVNESSVVISQQTVVVNVTDKQEKPIFKQLFEKVPSASDDTDYPNSFDGCFDFTFAGNTYKSKIPGDDSQYTATISSGSTQSYFVKEATVKVSFTVKDFRNWSGSKLGTYNYDLKATINKLIKTK